MKIETGIARLTDWQAVADEKPTQHTTQHTEKHMKNENTIGTLAFFDSFAGLIPCKVIEIKDDFGLNEKYAGKTSGCKIQAKITARRGAYLPGEIIESTALHIIPRKNISRRKYGARIIGGYSWKN